MPWFPQQTVKLPKAINCLSIPICIITWSKNTRLPAIYQVCESTLTGQETFLVHSWLPPVLIHFNRVFHGKPSSYWGTMWKPPYQNQSIREWDETKNQQTLSRFQNSSTTLFFPDVPRVVDATGKCSINISLPSIPLLHKVLHPPTSRGIWLGWTLRSSSCCHPRPGPTHLQPWPSSAWRANIGRDAAPSSPKA